MTVIKKLKEWVLAWIWIWAWFVLVGGITWIAYASYSWVTQSEVTSWDTLSASSWNDMLNNQNFLKQEVENIDTTWFVTKAWDTMGGELSMGTNKITSLWTPTATTDAATKAYVDSVSASGEGMYQVTCTIYGTTRTLCFRVNTITGETECKYSSNLWWTSWDNCNYAPW